MCSFTELFRKKYSGFENFIIGRKDRGSSTGGKY